MSAAKQTAASGGSSQSRVAWRHRWVLVKRNWWLFTAAVVGFHLVFWTVKSPQKQEVNWILFTSDSPVGLVIAVAVVLGALLTLLIRQQRELGSSDSHGRPNAGPENTGADPSANGS